MTFRTLTVAGICALFCCAVVVNSVAAQEKMTKDQWQAEMTGLTKDQADLTKSLDKLTKDVDSLKIVLAGLGKKVQTVKDETMAMTGANQEHRNVFEDALAAVEASIDQLAKLAPQDLFTRKAEIDSVQAALDVLKKQKLAAVQPYFDRMTTDQKKIDALRASIANVIPAEKVYIVGTWAKDRDCLWNISKKKDIYANPFMWPKIWQGNRDQIKDPDIIHPGQKLKIPTAGELTAAEKKAERQYWRKKAH
ncbi:MAG: LysM peptidoglycan-binding domain-containing protein [Ignavibacteriales bacterium]|nr:LysM peptidoglycan-binding domain-containing protein [Ignavibacteriales bacterium]